MKTTHSLDTTARPDPGAGLLARHKVRRALQTTAWEGRPTIADGTADTATRARLVLRDPADLVFLPLAAVHGVVIWMWPSMAVIAIGLWWNLNTIAHNIIHRPFFRSRILNRAFALYLTALTGVPQTVWRERHLAHHAGRRWRLRVSEAVITELAIVVILWAAMAAASPRYWLSNYLPGYLVGLCFCALHGRYEHADGTTSHYGKLYNWLFFNDGYHCEHHASPARSWRRLPQHKLDAARTSRWPAVLRWLDHLPVCRMLNLCERLALHSAVCRRFVVDSHARAFSRLAGQLPPVARVAIVGGGLFPRTAIVVRRVLPEAQITLIDVSRPNLLVARRLLHEPVGWINELYDPARHTGFDFVVIPLAYVGDREALYSRPPAPAVLVHDWIWRVRGRGVVVSWWLLKRINLVRGCEPFRC
jgi:hypothetical protein